MAKQSCEGCAGTKSHKAGGCSSGTCGPDPQREKIQKNLSRIGQTLVVMSGKGGVGKSTVAVNLAVGLAMAGKRTGLLDVDIHGPSVPRLLCLEKEKPVMQADCMEPVLWPGAAEGMLRVMSLGFLLSDPKDAVIWRGPVKIGLIRQFIADVAWGELDYLVVDCPPGTGDEPLSVLQETGSRAQGIVVTTPQVLALDDVRRSVTFVKQVGNEVLGLVENMSGYVCSGCGHVEHIFPVRPEADARALAQEMDIPFLGSLPLDPHLGAQADEGRPAVTLPEDSPVKQAFDTLVSRLIS